MHGFCILALHPSAYMAYLSACTPYIYIYIYIYMYTCLYIYIYIEICLRFLLMNGDCSSCAYLIRHPPPSALPAPISAAWRDMPAQEASEPKTGVAARAFEVGFGV